METTTWDLDIESQYPASVLTKTDVRPIPNRTDVEKKLLQSLE